MIYDHDITHFVTKWCDCLICIINNHANAISMILRGTTKHPKNIYMFLYHKNAFLIYLLQSTQYYILWTECSFSMIVIFKKLRVKEWCFSDSFVAFEPVNHFDGEWWGTLFDSTYWLSSLWLPLTTWQWHRNCWERYMRSHRSPKYLTSLQ